MPSRFKHSRRERNRSNRAQPGARIEQWGGDKEEAPATAGAGARAPGGVAGRAKQAARAKAQAAAGALAYSIALLTVSYQALKAARTDPARALRYE